MAGTRRKGLADITAEGDRRKALQALREHLARALDSADERYIAPLAKQLADVMRELDALPTGKEVSPVDDLAKRRVQRRKKASGL